MGLFLGAAANGVASGVLYGLLAFAIVLLYKSTGVANFAQGNLGTFATFVVYKLAGSHGMPLGPAVIIGIVAGAAVGALSYGVGLRPVDNASHLNLTLRTLGLYLLLLAIMNYAWSAGQPFAFPKIFPTARAFGIGEAVVSWYEVCTVLLAAAMATGFVLIFRYTRVGRLAIGVSDRPEIAHLLGVSVRRVTLAAWTVSSAVALAVAIVAAPATLLSTTMMDLYLLFAFTSAVVGGLTSLVGAFVGGLLVGLVNSIASVYVNSDLAALCVFCLPLIVLSIRPNGIFSSVGVERL